MIEKCLKCRLGYRTPPKGTAVADAINRFGVALREWAPSLTRADIDRLKTAHAALVRASKGRHCALCIDADVAFANQIIDAIQPSSASSG